MNDSIFSKIFEIISLKRDRNINGRIFKTDSEYITFTYDDLINLFCFLDTGRSSVRLLRFSDASYYISEDLEKISLDALQTDLITLMEKHRAFYLVYGLIEPGCQGGHIGRNNSVLSYENNKMEVRKSDDSFEIFIKFLKYFSNSCKDLIEIRRSTIALLKYLKDNDETLETSVFESIDDLESGINILMKYALVFERVHIIVQTILKEFASFQKRKSVLLAKSVNEIGSISSLLLAISKVRQ
jgi:hypothetical protein